MSDTGATPVQVEAAAERRMAAMRLGPTYRERMVGYAETYAAYLVPPDHRIVGPGDLAALRRVSRAAERWLNGDDSEDDPAWAGLRPGDIERVTAIGGES